MGKSTLTFKATALFFYFFGLQFALLPDFLMADNFEAGSYKLDRWHYFVMRGCGTVIISMATYLWLTSPEADKYMLPVFIHFTISMATFPWYAQLYLPVTTKHLIATVGSALLWAAQLSCLMSPESKAKGKRK